MLIVIFKMMVEIVYHLNEVTPLKYTRNIQVDGGLEDE
jgi:hypothetical protein